MNRVLKFSTVIPVVLFCVSCDFVREKSVKPDEPKSVKEELEIPYIKPFRDSVYKDWQIINGERISFAVPSGWMVETWKGETSLVFNIRPPEFKEQKDVYVFEFIEEKADDWKFEHAVNGVIEYYTKKSGELPQIINNLNTRILGYPAKEFDINVSAGKKILPVKAYMIKCGRYYYLLSYVKHVEKSTAMDKIFRSVLRSIVIEQ